ncbi:AAA family ATPase [Paenibacillus sp. GCM10027627]|uniref:AAA family ATPase n=1 Tax=unclassified Paenibacillus TaxID=185978 RepID=UPI003637DC85
MQQNGAAKRSGAQTLRTIINEHGRMETEAFLEMARMIAACVGQFHQTRNCHGRLRPELLHLDFSANKAEIYHLEENSSLEQLAYCSPENTGRMNRTVDERSDLYSLGIMFYEMLAGRLPFQTDDSLEWVYMHLAQSPPPLVQIRPDLPEDLALLVMKLLEKNPENRYPNAAFLIADLDTVGQAREASAGDSGCYGRENETAALIQAFHSACLGAAEIVYVSGESGIGKTSLIDSVFRKQKHSRNFFYISGKFEELPKESPYHPITQAFGGLIRHLLGERKEQRDQWAHRLREALSSNVSVISSIIPEVGVLLGEMPEAEELPGAESKNRFVYLFRKFVQALASKSNPLVWFIDDLQWADASSLQLLHELLRDPECQYMMIVGAYRHQEKNSPALPGYEADGSFTAHATVRHVQLTSLHLKHMVKMVRDTLNASDETTLPLAEALYSQSKGNPFHFKQILLRIQDDRLLEYSHEQRRWHLDMWRLIEQEPNYSIEGLIDYKLRRLSPSSMELLHIMACIGGQFSSSFVANVAKQEAGPVDAACKTLESEGLLVRIPSGSFRFSHDNMQKAIYNRISAVSKTKLHLQIGLCMRERGSGYEDDAFESVNHLNRGSAHIKDFTQLHELIRLNLDAGIRAKSSSAHDIALLYFDHGIGLLSQDDWSSSFDLCFELHAQKAECDYLCGNISMSETGIETLLGVARNRIERSRIRMIQIMHYINKGKYSEGTALGLQTLQEFNIDIPVHPSNLLLLMEGKRTELLLRNRIDKLPALREMNDPEWIAAMDLIFSIISSTFFTNKKVFFLLVCKGVRLSLQHGNSPVSAAIYTAYGMLLGAVADQFEKGYSIGKIGLELSGRYNNSSVNSRVYTIFGGVLCQFAGDARASDSYMKQALQFGINAGDLVFASYAVGAHINSLYTRSPLGHLARTLTEYLNVISTLNEEFVRQNIYLYQQYIDALQGKTDAPDSFNSFGFEEERFLTLISREETSSTTLFQFCTYKTQLCYLLGRYEEAVGWARQAFQHERYATHLPHLPECLFYESLAMLVAMKPATKRQRNLRHGRLGAILKRIEKLALWSPANFKPRSLLLQAELARATGQSEQAELLYDRAIRESRERDDLQTASLAGELAAHYFWSVGKKNSALHYLQLALSSYTKWEISIKVDSLTKLQREWAALREAAFDSAYPYKPSAETDTKQQPAAAEIRAAASGNEDSSLDLEAMLRALRATSVQMDMNTVVHEIVGTIKKYAGASKAALLTEGGNDALFIQAYADSDDSQSGLLAGEFIDSALLPEGIIRYGFRTGESVYFDAHSENWLIHNPYISQNRPQSVVCLPIRVNGAVLGILYLENKHASAVFAPERLEVLLSMASHGILLSILQSSSDQSSELEPEASREASSDVSTIEEPLTDRELEVLALLAAGLSNKEIADRLVIAIGTVKVHIKHIFAKLKVNRRTKAIAHAKELNLLG